MAQLIWLLLRSRLTAKAHQVMSARHIHSLIERLRVSDPTGSKKGSYVDFHWLEICLVRGAVILNVRRSLIRFFYFNH